MVHDSEFTEILGAVARVNQSSGATALARSATLFVSFAGWFAEGIHDVAGVTFLLASF